MSLVIIDIAIFATLIPARKFRATQKGPENWSRAKIIEKCRKNILPALLQKLVAEFFLIFRREI